MKSQQDHIQALIAEIDAVLSKPSPRLPWMAAGETGQQRQVLERLRSYLTAQESKTAVSETLTQSHTGQSPPQRTQTSEVVPAAAQEIVQAVTQEINFLRESLTHPLHEEIQALRQEQQSLIREIKQLESRQQQQNSLAQQQANQQQIIAEFMQVLMSRLHESLSHEVAQTFAKLEEQYVYGAALPADRRLSTPEVGAEGIQAGELSTLTPAQRLERLRLLQAQSDHLMMSLDSSVSVVFTTLQQNLQSYQESLSQGIDKMHNLGQQGEAMFAALVNHLAQMLGREASSFVKPPVELESVAESPRNRLPEPPAPEPTQVESVSERERLPYPGTELSVRFAQMRREHEETLQPPPLPEILTPEAEPPAPEPVTDETLDDLYSNLFSPETAAENPEPVADETLDDLYSNLFSPETAAENPEPVALAPEPVADETLDDLYSNLFSPETAAENPEPVAPAKKVLPHVEAAPVPQESNLEGEFLEDFLVAEDSEFVVGSADSPTLLEFGSMSEDSPTLLEFAEIEPEEVAAPTFEPASPVEAGETLTDLNDVFADASPATASPPASPPQDSPETNDISLFTEEQGDIYILASPDENLLPTEEPEVESVEQDLILDTSTLQQLQADLYSLEGIESREVEEFGDAGAPESFGRFTEALDFEAENPFVVSAEEEIASLEDLFAEVSDPALQTSVEDFDPEATAAAFAAADDVPDVTLEDILASLTEAEETPVSNFDPLTTGRLRTGANFNTVRPGLDSPDRQKKNIALPETLADEGTLVEVLQQEESAPLVAAVPYLFGSPPASKTRPDSGWYLGIDFGTTGLSAALANRKSGEVYPIYWELAARNLLDPQLRVSFRLPTVAYLSPIEGELGRSSQVAVKLAGDLGSPLPSEGLLLQNFKLPLRVGLPYATAEAGAEDATPPQFEPLLQWSPSQPISLAWLLHALRSLLTCLQPTPGQAEGFGQGEREKETEIEEDFLLEDFQAEENALSPNQIYCKAVGLSPERLQAALGELEGVVMGCPADWPEAYRFNLREAVLGAGLVADSSQIFVIEDAIAILLSELTTRPELGLHDEHSILQPDSLKGGTLIMGAGATTIELALVDVPETLAGLNHSQFRCHSFPYGGNALDQDIICQLLLRDDSLGLLAEMPQPGHPELSKRWQLQQRLQSSSLGQALLEAAAQLKTVLQYQDRFHVEIGEQRWEIKRRDLESRVFVPFVQQLNRELNALLSQIGMSPVAINQAICTGGMGAMPAIARWLRQKLPNAVVIQDTQLRDEAQGSATALDLKQAQCQPTISRVACGLASLALYPQVLDVPRHQYGDYFLLWELAIACKDQPLPLREIMLLLEGRGINTRACESRILAILNGEIPAGLVPSAEDQILLAATSRQNPEIQQLQVAPLFHKEGHQLYRLNTEQSRYFRRYFSRLTASSQQKLEEPLFQSLAVSV